MIFPHFMIFNTYNIPVVALGDNEIAPVCSRNGFTRYIMAPLLESKGSLKKRPAESASLKITIF
jgi:hypothetical protein